VDACELRQGAQAQTWEQCQVRARARALQRDQGPQ